MVSSSVQSMLSRVYCTSRKTATGQANCSSQCMYKHLGLCREGEDPGPGPRGPIPALAFPAPTPILHGLFRGEPRLGNLHSRSLPGRAHHHYEITYCSTRVKGPQTPGQSWGQLSSDLHIGKVVDSMRPTRQMVYLFVFWHLITRVKTRRAFARSWL